MRRLSVLMFAFALLCSSEVYAARKVSSLAACSRILTTSNGFIYKNSAPLRSGGVGTPLIGYRKEPSLIMSSYRGSVSRTAHIYDKASKKIGSCPWASAHDTAGGRYRCTMNTAGLRRTAVKNTRSPEAYFKINGSTCVKVDDVGRCYGSSKGLCNQLIK